jgi:23S rRNA (cytosine1962-C5)-methyltransferase
MQKLILSARRPVSVLNLFAYTGGATMACAKVGAKVVHVDAAKGMVGWARENAKLCGLIDAPVRYIVDDAMSFVQREFRRGRAYDAVVMDPPSYGRGPDGQMFRFEDDAYPLVAACAKLLSETPLFFVLNSYTAGFAPTVVQNMLKTALDGGNVEADNIGLPMDKALALPCGATARWTP